jgi:hypothetical protein
MTKTVEQMVEEVEKKIRSSTRDDNGFSGTFIESRVPSTERTAIAYQTGGSNWNRSGFGGGGIAKFQGTSVYNGTVNLCIKPHVQWRSSSSANMDNPGARYSVDKFEDLGNSRYRLEISNCYGRESLIVDFERGEALDEQFFSS